MPVESGAAARTERHHELALIGRKANVDVISKFGTVAQRYLFVVEAFHFHLHRMLNGQRDKADELTTFRVQ